MKKYCSPNYDIRDLGVLVDMLVIHYTGMHSAEGAIDRMCDPGSGVSAHYCICEDGTVFQLVNEEKRAWHAGEAFWRGKKNINARSIGVELVNPGHSIGYSVFPERQIAALETLCLEILSRYNIPPHNFVGHSDIAPRRKLDPGELFPWRRLAIRGVGIWPQKECSGFGLSVEHLPRFGYEMKNQEATIRAFQRRFRPKLIDGIWDKECAGLLAGLPLSD